MNQHNFNVAEYWEGHPKPSWVVTLLVVRKIINKPTGRSRRNGSRNRKAKRRDYTTKYVTAKTEAGAIRTALHFNFGKGKVISASARLASPTELGATPFEPNQLKLKK